VHMTACDAAALHLWRACNPPTHFRGGRPSRLIFAHAQSLHHGLSFVKNLHTAYTQLLHTDTVLSTKEERNSNRRLDAPCDAMFMRGIRLIGLAVCHLTAVVPNSRSTFWILRLGFWIVCTALLRFMDHTKYYTANTGSAT